MSRLLVRSRHYRRSYVLLGASLAIAIAGLWFRDGRALVAFFVSFAIVVFVAFADRTGALWAPRPRWRAELSENEAITQAYLASRHGLDIDTERSVEPYGRPENYGR